MKKIMILAMALVMFLMQGSNVYASSALNAEKAIKETGVSDVIIDRSDIPKGVEPLVVESEEDLKKLIEILETPLVDDASVDSSVFINNKEIQNTRALGTLITNNKQVVNATTVTNLGLVGSVISYVGYTYSYWVAPESWTVNVDWKSVDTGGLFIYAGHTLYNQSYSVSGPYINVSVSGCVHVYSDIYGIVHLYSKPYTTNYSIFAGN
jgi:hypothetical protein